MSTVGQNVEKSSLQLSAFGCGQLQPTSRWTQMHRAVRQDHLQRPFVQEALLRALRKMFRLDGTWMQMWSQGKLECFVDPLTAMCRVPKVWVLPFWEHPAQINCGEDPAEAKCPLPWDVRLKCSHNCTQRCHIREDPNHELYHCKKSCERLKSGCKKDRRCGRKCFEDCDPCVIKWNRDLPCGHSHLVQCHFNDEDFFCE